MIRTGHHSDIFQPLPADTLVARLESVGFSAVELDIAEYEIRFTAPKSL